MNTTHNIRDVFSIFHDGIINSFTGDESSLLLEVECHYLAKRIDNSFNNFYIELKEINKLYLQTWPNPFDQPVKVLKKATDIFRAKLEILSVDLKDGNAVIDCNQHNLDFDYCGGYLTLACNSTKVYDQNKNELTIDYLNSICKEYWNECGKN